MKKLFLTVFLGILFHNTFSQDSFSVLAYQATKETIYNIETREKEISLSETIFQFDPGKATVGTYGNLRDFIVGNNPLFDIFRSYCLESSGYR